MNFESWYGFVLLHRQWQANREVPRPGPQRVAHGDVARSQGFVDGDETVPARDLWRKVPEQVAHHRHDVGFIDGAGDADEITECRAHARGVVGHPLRDVGMLEATLIGYPQRQGEVVQGDYRHDAAFTTGREDRAVVVECFAREGTVLWFDTGPLDREPKGVEPERGEDVEILLVPIPGVAGVTADFDRGGALGPLESPPIGVRVATFDLVRRRGRAP